MSAGRRAAPGDERLGRRRRRSCSARRGSCSPAADLARLAEGNSRWASLLDPEKALRVPAADRDELLARLLAAPDLPRLELPESMRFEEARRPPAAPPPPPPLLGARRAARRALLPL